MESNESAGRDDAASKSSGGPRRPGRARPSRVSRIAGFAGAAIALAILIAAHHQEMRRRDLAEATRLVHASVERIRSAAEVWISERQSDARDLSALAWSESNVFTAPAARAGDQGDAEKDLARALAIAERAYGYTEARALTPDGRVAASATGQPIGDEEVAMARSVAASGAPSNAITRSHAGSVQVSFAAPVRERSRGDGTGRVIGVVMLTADAAALGRVVLLEPVGVSTGERRLVFAAHDDVAVLTAYRLSDKGPWFTRWDRGGPVDSLALRRRDTALLRVDSAGATEIAVALPIPGAAMGVVRLVPTTGIYTEANRTALMEALMAVAVLAVVWLVLELIGVAQREKAESLLTSTIDAAPVAIVAVDHNYNVTRWNATAERIFGWQAAEVIGRPLPFVPDDKQEEFRALQVVERSGAPVDRIEVTRMAKSGARVRVQLSTASIFDEDGRLREVIGFFTDLTEQRRLEEQLRQSQKMEAVGQLAGGVAHDFNNVLTAIQGHAELVRSALPAGSPEREDIDAVLAGAARAAALTRQLLAYSRKQLLRPDVLQVNTVVTGVRSLLRATMGEDIDLRIEPGDGAGNVRADRVQLEQVLLNLAVNARDAMPNGGTLTIRTEARTVEGTLRLREDEVRAGRYAAVIVSDTGQGIPADVRGRIFEPFFTTKDVGKGTGLGLSTVFGIVKQSGGYVTVDSEPGHGSTFTVLLPMVDAEAAEAAEPQPVRRGTETILLVEDEEIVRTLTARMLQNGGYTVLEADSGHAAQRVSREYAGAIDLVLTDVVMPGMSGRELVAALAASRPTARVLYMSGYTDDEILRRGLRESGMVLLEKPYTEAVLLDAVYQALHAPPTR